MYITRALPEIGSWGLDHVDLHGRVFGKAAESLEADQVVELKQLLDRHGMKVGCLESSLAKVHLPEADRRRSEEAKLERVVRLAERARAEGLILAFENCGVTVDEVFTMFDLLDEPSWGSAV